MNRITFEDHWDFLSGAGHDVAVSRLSVWVKVLEDGSVEWRREYQDCWPLRSVRFLAFRDVPSSGGLIDAKNVPRLEVMVNAGNVVARCESSIQGGILWHRVIFPDKWNPEFGPLSFSISGRYPQFYLPPSEDGGLTSGTYSLANVWPTEAIAMSLEFPEGYVCTWAEPTLRPRQTPWPLSDEPLDPSGICLDLVWRPHDRSADLIIQKPIPGYVIGLRWKRVERGVNIEKDHDRGAVFDHDLRRRAAGSMG